MTKTKLPPHIDPNTIPGSLKDALALGICTAPGGPDIDPALVHIEAAVLGFLAQRFQVAIFKASGDTETVVALGALWRDLGGNRGNTK